MLVRETPVQRLAVTITVRDAAHTQRLLVDIHVARVAPEEPIVAVVAVAVGVAFFLRGQTMVLQIRVSVPVVAVKRVRFGSVKFS